MGIELIKDRLFTPEDTRDRPPVIVIDEVLARQHFPNEDPLGKRLKQSTGSDAPSLEIVGVVRHVEPYGLDRLDTDAGPAQFYTNFNQAPLPSVSRRPGTINLLTRTEAEPFDFGTLIWALPSFWCNRPGGLRASLCPFGRPAIRRKKCVFGSKR
jgi:putative ABC transport system permease protein